MAEQFEYLSYYQDKTILVTGASGYIGSAVINKLNYISCTITALIKKGEVFPGFPKGKAKISIFEADIQDSQIWNNLLAKVDILFHFAAQTSSKYANDNPLMDAKINLLPVINIIETCQKQNFSPRIIFSGTVTQVGLTKTYPVNETLQDLPATVYDINKLAAEKYLQYYSNQLGKSAVILRLSNVYGPGPASSSADRGFLNAMMRKAIIGDPLTIYGEGNFIRDYVYIDDVAEAFLIAGAKIEVLKRNYYIIGSGVGHTIKEAIELIQQVFFQKTGRKIEIQHIPAPKNLSPIEYRNFVADTTNFSANTGWKARVGLREGISRTIDYFLKERKR